tara:strand:+ start:848 stop:1258 length:411 start_codon:yes stop_codon:yes gene_type:complete
MSLNKVKIYEDDFDLFVLLNDSNKIEFLYDINSLGTRGAMLKQVAKYEQSTHEEEFRLAHVEDLKVGIYRLCIVKYDDSITFNCNNLSVINRFVDKIWEQGNILVRNKEIKKTSMDIYKYFKAYNVIKLGMPISDN